MSQYKESDYFFVVFKIEDKEEFAKHSGQMSAAMMNGERVYGAHVTSCGQGDVATERDALAEFILQEHDEAPDGIIQAFIDEENRCVEDL